MNILNNLFIAKKEKKSTNKFSNTISNILVILENLAFLNTKEIRESLNNNKLTCDEELLNKLIVDSKEKEKFAHLRKYLTVEAIGYKEEKIKEIKEQLEKENTEKDIIFKAKLEISKYEKTLEEFEQIIKTIDDNPKLTEIDKVALVDYWLNNFNENYLGAKINLNNKINDYIYNLKNLEYNGLGPDKIVEFQTNAKELIKNNQTLSTNKILALIDTELYQPILTKYQKELVVLKNKIKLITDTKELNQQAKQEKIEEFILDFNLRNGHPLDLSTNLLTLKNKLTSLKYGGYRNHKLEDFIKKANDIIIYLKQNKSSDKFVLVKLRLLYQDYLNKYNQEVEILEKEISKNNNKEVYLIEHFQEKFGHNINLDIRIAEFQEKLKKQIEISDILTYFNEEIIKITEKEQSISKKLLEVERLYSVILNSELNKEYVKLREKISYYRDILANLENNGYNDDALKEFLNSSYDILYNRYSLSEKSIIIDKLYKNLVEDYYFNLQVYTIWKEERLKAGDNKELIENEIKHLLTLSRKELQIYLEKDDQLKKEHMEKHNLFLAITHLATKEANINKDPHILEEKLADLEKGIINYSEEEIAEATKELEEKEYLDIERKLSKDDKLISIADYIDSTLYKQIITIRTALEKSKI